MWHLDEFRHSPLVTSLVRPLKWTGYQCLGCHNSIGKHQQQGWKTAEAKNCAINEIDACNLAQILIVVVSARIDFPQHSSLSYTCLFLLHTVTLNSMIVHE